MTMVELEVPQGTDMEVDTRHMKTLDPVVDSVQLGHTWLLSTAAVRPLTHTKWPNCRCGPMRFNAKDVMSVASNYIVLDNGQSRSSTCNGAHLSLEPCLPLHHPCARTDYCVCCVCSQVTEAAAAAAAANTPAAAMLMVDLELKGGVKV